jgi:hypothetical protein
MRIHVLALALFAYRVALAQTPRSRPKPSATPVGILIGWAAQQGVPADGSDSARLAADSARSGRTTTSEITLFDGRKVVHIDETEQADRLSTLWVFVSGGKVTTRRVQHIIIPRRDGFWKLGMNTDSATLNLNGGSSQDQEDFVWVAPLGERPTLGAIDSYQVTCHGAATTRQLTYVGPDYLGFTAFGESVCVHYDNSSWWGVESIAALYAAPKDRSGVAEAAEDLALLGPRAVAEHGRLAHAATRWPNDCGVAGFEGPTTNWTIRRRRGHWEAAVLFHGSGLGICGRYNEDRALHTSLPRAVVSPETPLPVAWATAKKLVPDATDATTSPDGRVVIVLSPTRVIVTTLEGRVLRALSAPIVVASGAPVMLEWARGPGAIRWDRLLSALPRWP